jgi:hypothetical protein
MINLSPVRRPTRRLVIFWLEHGTRHLLLSRPNGVSIFFRVFSSQEITTLRLRPPLPRMQGLPNSRFRCISSTIREALVSLIVEKVTLHASCLDTRERREASTLTLKGLQSPSRLGICSAMSRARFPLRPRFRNTFQVRPVHRNPGCVSCPQIPAARVHA